MSNFSLHRKVTSLVRRISKYVVILVFSNLGFTINIYAQAPSEGLIAYFPFNGNAKDESGNIYNGIVHSALLTTDRCGSENSAYYFNGTSSYIDLENPLLPINGADFSVSLWVKSENSMDDNVIHAIVGQYQNIPAGRFHLFEHNGKLRLFSGESEYPSSNPSYELAEVIPEKWTNIILICKGNLVDAYVNCSLVGVDLPIVNILNTNTIIGWDGFADRFYKGKIDDIRIYNRTLDISEVCKLYYEKPCDEQAVIIDGDLSFCAGIQSQNYAASEIGCAINYVWSYSGTGMAMTSSNNALRADFSEDATNGDLSVSVELADGTIINSDNYFISIDSLPSAAVDITGDTEVCLGGNGNAYQVTAIDNATNYNWSYSGDGASIVGNSNSVFVSFYENSSPGSLSVYGVNDCGFGAASELPITLKNCNLTPASLRIPNSFTPNGDGINERFVIDGLNENTSLLIFNRYGKKLYESNNYQNNWDGKDMDGNILSTGTYWYKLTIPGILEPFNGFVYLKR